MKDQKVRISESAALILEKVAPKGGKITKTGYVSEAVIEKHTKEKEGK